MVVLAERLFRPRHNVRLQILQAQIRFLRSRIDTSGIVPSPDEKHELLRLGALLLRYALRQPGGHRLTI